MAAVNELPTPQRGQIWRDKYTGYTCEVLDDRRVHGGWAVLIAAIDGAPSVSVRNLHSGSYEPPSPEIPTYWVNVYAGGPDGVHRSVKMADEDEGVYPQRICRVPLVPDWDNAVYDDV